MSARIYFNQRERFILGSFLISAKKLYGLSFAEPTALTQASTIPDGTEASAAV
jgi:hypothetical protein